MLKELQLDTLGYLRAPFGFTHAGEVNFRSILFAKVKKHMNSKITQIWNEFAFRQKIILSIYAIIGLPVLPIVLIIWPFAKWTTTPIEQKGTVKALFTTSEGWVEILSAAMALSLLALLFIALIYSTR